MNKLSDKELSKRKYAFPEERKFPMPDKAHALSAIRFFNYVSPENEAKLAKEILKRMREYGITNVNVGPKNRFSKYYHRSKEDKKMNNTELVHSAKGTTWGKHKYIRIENGRYIYPEDIRRQEGYGSLQGDYLRAERFGRNRGSAANQQARVTTARNRQSGINAVNARSTGMASRIQKENAQTLANQRGRVLEQRVRAENKANNKRNHQAAIASNYTTKASTADQARAKSASNKANSQLTKASRIANTRGRAQAERVENENFARASQRLSDRYKKAAERNRVAGNADDINRRNSRDKANAQIAKTNFNKTLTRDSVRGRAQEERVRDENQAKAAQALNRRYDRGAERNRIAGNADSEKRSASRNSANERIRGNNTRAALERNERLHASSNNPSLKNFANRGYMEGGNNPTRNYSEKDRQRLRKNGMSVDADARVYRQSDVNQTKNKAYAAKNKVAKEVQDVMENVGENWDKLKKKAKNLSSSGRAYIASIFGWNS